MDDLDRIAAERAAQRAAAAEGAARARSAAFQEAERALRREIAGLVSQFVEYVTQHGWIGASLEVTETITRRFGGTKYRKVSRAAYQLESVRAPFKDTTVDYRAYVIAATGQIMIDGGYGYGAPQDILIEADPSGEILDEEGRERVLQFLVHIRDELVRVLAGGVAPFHSLSLE